jgi:hypothetical protein
MSRFRASGTFAYVKVSSSRFQDLCVYVVSRLQDLCVCQSLQGQGPLRMSMVRGSRTSAYVKVSRFQDLCGVRFQALCACQCVEVPGRLSRFRGSRTSAYAKVSRFQDLCVCQGLQDSRFQDLRGFEVPGPLRMSRARRSEVPGPPRFRGFRTYAYVKVCRFQDLCVCQGFEVPGPLRMSWNTHCGLQPAAAWHVLTRSAGVTQIHK